MIAQGGAAALERTPTPARAGGADVSAQAARVPPVPEAATAQDGAEAPTETLRWPVRPSSEDVAVVDLFAKPPPPPAAAPEATSAAPPPVLPLEAIALPPTAPAFPYAVIGDWTEDRSTAAFLAARNEVKLIHINDLIDGVYRVQGLAPGKMIVIYVPMNQPQEITWSIQP